MSTWSDTRLVAAREVGEKLRSRSFLLSTLLFLVLVAASVAVPALLSGDGAEDYDVAVTSPAALALVEAVPVDEVDLAPREVRADEVAGLLEDEDVDAAVDVGPEGLLVTAQAEVPDDLRDALLATAQVTRVQEALAAAGATPDEVAAALAAVPVSERLLDDPGVDPAVIPLLGVAFGVLFFFVVYQFGFAIAQGVTQEKESRIVEILVSAVPVRTLLYGKVLGHGSLALAQVVLLALVAIGGAAATGEGELVSLLARNSAWFVLFFALGFALLSCLWAAAGAFASRQEDLQSTTVPLQLLVIVPFFAGVYVTAEPLRTVLSFVPLTSPLVMPARLVAGDAAAWEGAVAALLLLAAAALAVRVGERLYRASLLRTRGTTSLAEAWQGRVGAPR